MLSKRIILLLSTAATLALYVLLLWAAPWVTILESDRLATRITTRFQMALVTETKPRVSPSPQGSSEAVTLADLSQAFGKDPGMLEVEDTSVAPPVDTPQLAERIAAEPLDRNYDTDPEPTRITSTDAKILEISQETARQDISITRRLVRPNPDFILPAGVLPVLRSRDAEPGDILLEPVRLGPGLLVQALAPHEQGDESPSSSSSPSYDPVIFTGAGIGGEKTIPSLDQEIVNTPIYQEIQQVKKESPYTFLDDLMDIQLEIYTPQKNDLGYFRLRILPRSDALFDAAPRDITFILDASRSMQQRKLDLASRALTDIITKLRPQDRFNILLFRDTVTPFQPHLVQATPDAITSARSFLSGIESKGQTDIYNALLSIGQLQPRDDLPGIILVISDGNPTTGERDSRTIINRITEENRLRNTIVAYGAGNTVNRYLLDLLAYRNKGECFISSSLQTIREDLVAFADRFGTPLLVNIRADYTHAVEEELYPKVIPDFFEKRPLVLFGRFTKDENQEFAVRITGTLGGRKKELLFKANLREAKQGGAEIAQGWAFQKAYHLIGEISRYGERPELLEQLRLLKEYYAIRTIYD